MVRVIPRFVLIALVLLPHAAAEIAVCLDTATIEKPHLSNPAEDKATLDRMNLALKSTLAAQSKEAYDFLMKEKSRLPKPTIPIRFAADRDCRKVDLVIHTSGVVLDAELLYHNHQLFPPVPLRSNWTFEAGGSDPKIADLFYSAVEAIRSNLSALGLGLFTSIVEEISEDTNKNHLLPVTLPPGVLKRCAEEGACAVLPSMAFNDYLMKSSFKLDLKMEEVEGGYPVVATGIGYCTSYKDTERQGIVLENPKDDVPKIAHPWTSVQFSLKTLNLPTDGEACGAVVPSRPLASSTARGKQ